MAYNGWGIYDLTVWIWLKWWATYDKCFIGKICSKNAGLQGSRMTGFCPFELPTCGPYYREGKTTPHLRLGSLRSKLYSS